MKSIILLSIILAGAFAVTLDYDCDCTASVYVPGEFYVLGECAQDGYGDLYVVNAELESETNA